MSSTQRKRSGARKAQKRGRKLTGAPRRKAAGPRRRRKPARRSASLALRYCADAGVFVLTALVALAFATAWFARDLPSTDNLWRTNRNAEHVFLTMDGAPISRPGAGAPVRLAALPAHVPGAILAIEDRNFRHHVGVNPFAVGRAFLVNAAEGSVRQGGSTITQQLAKNLFLSSDRTVKRKVQELMLALWLERRFTKDEILTLYLNRVYFGAGAYGIDAASRRYFDKPAARLDIAEAAVLAGLLKAPSRYAPSHNPQIAGARARLAIDAMVETNVITRAQAQAALSAPFNRTGAL
ncbi:MAG: transglycosylase domain-containing protein, partial [Pseudomonadota bacterium]